jgi:ribosomal protein S18 acetylase RimI-like enzyme
MTIVVRPVAASEYDVAGEICITAYRADGQLSGAAADYAAELRDVAGRVREAEVLVAVDDDGRVLGCVTFAHPGTVWAEVARAGEGEFRMLAVAPPAQGRGVAAALVAACVERARELGYHAIAICVRDYNDTAKRLYARFGFVRTPEFDWVPVPHVSLEALRLDLETSRL